MKKISLLILMLTTFLPGLPFAAKASANENSAAIENISYQRGNKRWKSSRGKKVGWYNNRNWSRYRYGQRKRSKWVRKYYWRNGRRNVRYVRVYY